MNYLAHLFLSGEDQEVIIGNFIGDAIKGKDLSLYQQGIQNGIMMHRHIDTFADEHTIFRESKRIFAPKFDKYAGVLVDVYYDYFLAKNFEAHHHVPLPDFSNSIYELLQNNAIHLPPNSLLFLNYMIKYDILHAYSTIPGITRVLSGLTRRINGRIDLASSIPIFEENYLVLEKNFVDFFEEAKPHFKKWSNQVAQ